MEWNDVKGQWLQMKGSAKQRWGKFTDDDLDFVDGTRDRLIGRLVQKYGLSETEAERQADDWLRTHKNPAA